MYNVHAYIPEKAHECMPIFNNWFQKLKMLLFSVQVHDMSLCTPLPLTC